VLREAGADDADMLVAVTSSDETNMVACQVAYSLFNTPNRIARIRSPDYVRDAENCLIQKRCLSTTSSRQNSWYRQYLPSDRISGRAAGGELCRRKVSLAVVKAYYGGPWWQCAVHHARAYAAY
jgi:trk system potassium uptake protein TrkA